MQTASTRSADLTAKGGRTRARIIAAAAQLIHEHGVAGTTIEHVRAAAEVSGSQLYHYFADKDALVRAVIDARTDTIVESHEQATLDSVEGLRAWRDGVLAQAGSTSGRGGCPLGSLAGQLAESDAAARDQLADGFQRWSATLTDGLQTMHDKGQLAEGVEPQALAVTLLAALQGGLLLAQVQRDTDALKTTLDFILRLASPS